MITECQDEETEYCDPSWSREFPRKPDVQYAPDIAAQLDSVGQIDPLPRKKVGWKKSRADRKKPEPLREKVAYITIYSHHHRNRDYGWIDVAILSEIDFWMQKEKKACFASMRHLAAVGRIGRGTAHNHIARLEREGRVIDLGYRGQTKSRIVAPKHSAFPALSKRILAHLTMIFPSDVSLAKYMSEPPTCHWIMTRLNLGSNRNLSLGNDNTCHSAMTLR